jgi:hypothetical protein
MESETPQRALERASIQLDGRQSLKPGTADYQRYYVDRPQVESDLIREALRAESNRRPFHWFFGGHTGSGKSTELNRIMADPRLAPYLPIYIDLQEEFDIYNVRYADLFLAMGRACARKADEIDCPVSEELEKSIQLWGSEVFSEEELHTRTEGHAGLKISLPFLALGEEVQSGGGKREVIRTKISNDVLAFSRLINELAESLEEYTGQRVLCILDGLDHIDPKPAFDLLNENYRTLMLPKISKVFVIPLALLNTSFLATCDRLYSTVPNVKIFQTSGSEKLEEKGVSFYKEVISRYISLDFFGPDALTSLCRLSAGILRDMIRNTGDACSHAVDSGASLVTNEHVEKVWHSVMRFYMNQLHSSDYETLRRVSQLPLLEKGLDGVPSLLQNKAVIFYPNGLGWYGVHPAVQRMMRRNEAG